MWLCTFYSEIAKQLLSSGKKQQALVALKKKKLQETYLQRSQGQLDNVSTLIDSVEFAQIETKVFAALKAGNVALAQLHEQIGGVEAVESLLLDTEDAIARQQEIDDALSNSIAAEAIDEDEILAELDALEAAESGVDSLPDAPKHTPVDPRATATAAKGSATATTASSSTTTASATADKPKKQAVLA